MLPFSLRFLLRFFSFCASLCYAELAWKPVCFADEPTDRAVLIVQRDYLDNADLKKEMSSYIRLVKHRFNTELIPYPVDPSISPAHLRVGLQKLHREKSITGALFVGQFEFPVFHNECGDESTMFSYYSDLDGEIEDRNKDGKFDFYDPWGNSRSPKEVHELWVAVIKPYYHTSMDFRSLDEIRSYFYKVNIHLERFVEASNNEAAILTSRDWPHLSHLHKSLEPIYGNCIKQRGGIDASGQPISTNPDDLRYILSQPAEICFLYVHSGSSQHVLDTPAFPGNCVLPGVLDYPGRLLLEDLDVKPRILSIWGCHALDIQNVKYMNNRSLADSYLLTPHFATQTILGSSRSIGLEQIEVLIPKCKEQCLAAAWRDYLNHCYSQAFLREWLSVRGAWEKERYGFDWGYCIFGNPFDQLGVESLATQSPTKREKTNQAVNGSRR